MEKISSSGRIIHKISEKQRPFEAVALIETMDCRRRHYFLETLHYNTNLCISVV